MKSESVSAHQTSKVLLNKNDNSYPFFSSGNFFQAKLTVAPSNDPLEKQADDVADTVMRKTDPSVSPAVQPITVQRKCSKCQNEEDKHVQRKEWGSVSSEVFASDHVATEKSFDSVSTTSSNVSESNTKQVQKAKGIYGIQRKCNHCQEEEAVQRKENERDEQTSEAPSIVSDALNSSGQALHPETKSFMESRFGYDFSNVRVHTDSLSAKSAQSIQALAYTSGNHIVFNHGQYAPGTERGDRLIAHELTHVVQQDGSGIQRHKKVQRAAVYWNPVSTTGDDVHQEVLAAFGTENKGGLFSEVPVPNAKTGVIDVLTVGTIGYADFVKTNGSLVGILKTGDQMFENIGNIKLRKQILLDGKKFEKEKFRNRSAPTWNGVSQTVKNVAGAPTQIQLGDLKPYDESAVKGGHAQLKDYEGGFNVVKDEVNEMTKGGKTDAPSTSLWSINFSTLTGLAIPKKYEFPTASGQKSKEIFLTFSFGGAFVEALKKADVKRYKEYNDIRQLNKLQGKLYVVEEGGGIYTYAYIPDIFTTPSSLASAPGATATASTPPFAPLMQIVNQDIKGRLSGSSFVSKKSTNASNASQHSASLPVPLKKIQRKSDDKEKQYKDTFDKEAFDKSVETYNTKFDETLKKKEMRELILYGDKIHAYEDLRSNLPNAKMPALSTDLQAPAKLLKSMEVWTYPGVGLLGFFRKLFGKTFVGVMNTFEHVKKKISDLAKKKDSGSVGSVTAAAIRVILKVIKLIGNYVVSTSLGLVISSLKEGVVNNFKKLAENLMSDEVEAKIKEFQDIKAKYEEYAEKSIDQWKKDFFGTWIEDFEQIERIREKVEPIVSTIEKMVRWGAGIIACASPPAIGCLWNIFKEIGMYFIAKIIQTCWFGKKVTGYIVNNFKFIQDLPVTIASGITTFANNHIPLPKGMDPIFADVKVSSGDYNMTCDEFDGDGAGEGGHRGEIYELIEEIGEERFKAFLNMFQKRCAGPCVLLTPERLKAMKDDLKQIDIADLDKIANGEQPENGVPIAVEDFLKDINKYTQKEKDTQKKYFDEQKAKEQKGAGEGNGGQGGDKGDKTDTAGSKAPTFTGILSKGTLSGTSVSISPAYRAYVHAGKPSDSALPTTPVKVDLKIFVYKDSTLEKVVEAPGFMLLFKRIDPDAVVFEVPEDTLIKSSGGTLSYGKGGSIKVKNDFINFGL